MAPTSVVSNWERESKFAPSMGHVVWHGADRKQRLTELEDADVVITSYALLRRDEELLAKLPLGTPSSTGAEHQNRSRRRPAPPSGSRRHGGSRSPARPSRTGCRDLVHLRLRQPRPARAARGSRSATGAPSTPATEGRRAAPRHHPPLSSAARRPRWRRPPERSRRTTSASSRASSGPLLGRAQEVRAQVMGEVERQGLAKSQLQILAALTRLARRPAIPAARAPARVQGRDSGKLVALRELLQTHRGRPPRAFFSQFTHAHPCARRSRRTASPTST